MVTEHKQPFWFCAMTWIGILFCWAMFYFLFIVIGKSTPPLFVLMPLLLIPFLLAGFLSYGIPLVVICSPQGLTVKTALLTREIPWCQIKKTIFQNVIGGDGTLNLSHPSFIVIKTTHRYYRYYLISRYIESYNDLVSTLKNYTLFHVLK